MKLPCKLYEHYNCDGHNHNDTRCTQLHPDGIPCPGDGKCVENYKAACHVGDVLRKFKKERTTHGR